MSRLVEISPDDVGKIRSDLISTRDGLDPFGSLRSRAWALGVSTAGFDDAIDVADSLTTRVLPTVDTHWNRAKDLANARYSGSLGICLPVVDDDWLDHPAPFATAPALDGGQVLTWAAGDAQEQEADKEETKKSSGIGGWLSDRWDDVTGAVDEGVDWVVDTATDTWDHILDAGAAIGDWWEQTTADLGAWIDEQGAGVREWIGEHVGIIRWFASAFRIVGWIVVGIGVVLTIGLGIIGAMGGTALGAVFGLGVGAVPGGAAGAMAGIQIGLKFVGAGFALVSVGDFLDVAADWGEGKIDGQDLVQQGSLELAFAATSLLGVGVIGKIGQKILKALPESTQRQLDEWIEKVLRRGDDANPPHVYPAYAGKPGFLKNGAIDPAAFDTAPDTAFFWSGRTSTGVDVGKTYSRQIASDNHGTTLEQLMDDRGIELPEWDPDDLQVQQMWADASAAYAENVSGEVRAVVGSNLRPGNVWQTVEIPRLEANPNVTRIIEIDPETGIERQIYP